MKTTKAQHRERMRVRRLAQNARTTYWQPAINKQHLNLRANTRRLRQIANGMLKVSL